MPPAQYLSNSKVGIADFAQVCLGAQQGRQLGLGKQVLQVIGCFQSQLGTVRWMALGRRLHGYQGCLTA